MVEIHLILGGARSGKSHFAEQRAQQLFDQSGSDTHLIYLATASAGDAEMAERIKHHQASRQANPDYQWQLIEEPIELSNVIKDAPTNTTILIDCLTLWLSNCLHQKCWSEQRDKLLTELTRCKANVVMVSNEVGSGIVPMGALSRQFVDESGWLHQQIAALSSSATLVVAGLPLTLKESKT